MKFLADHAEQFSGADLETLVNETCFDCIRAKQYDITNKAIMDTFQKTMDKMLAFRMNCTLRSLGENRQFDKM